MHFNWPVTFLPCGPVLTGTRSTDLLQYSSANFSILGRITETRFDGGGNAVLKNTGKALGLCPISSEHCLADVGGQRRRVVRQQVALNPAP